MSVWRRVVVSEGAGVVLAGVPLGRDLAPRPVLVEPYGHRPMGGY